MITTSGPDFIHPSKLSGASIVNGRREAAQQSVSCGKRDSISLSSEHKDSFHMELVSRLSHEVRTMTTTGDIQALKLAVSSGNYHPNPALIAARMILMED